MTPQTAVKTKSWTVQAISVTPLIGDMLDLVAQCKADVVCISATPPGARVHARYLCNQLRRRFPQLKLVVGLWNVQGDLNKALERIGCGAVIVATLADAHQQIRLLVPQPLPKNQRQAPLERVQQGMEVAHS